MRQHLPLSTLVSNLSPGEGVKRTSLIACGWPLTVKTAGGEMRDTLVFDTRICGSRSTLVQARYTVHSAHSSTSEASIIVVPGIILQPIWPEKFSFKNNNNRFFKLFPLAMTKADLMPTTEMIRYRRYVDQLVLHIFY